MTKAKQKPTSSNSTSAQNYACKPYRIGKVIQTLAEEKRITPMELGKKVGVGHRNIYRLFKARTMALPMLFKMSEALGQNLLLQYHPNVAPLPNPLEAENKQLKVEIAQLKKDLLQLNALSEENKVLKGQLDILREVMKGK